MGTVVLSVGWGTILPVGTYLERRPAPDLGGHLACSWTAVTGAPGRVLPDGCLDLMWLGGELVVAGPDTAAVGSGLAPGTEIAAVRFRPGAAPVVLGLPASELRDRRVPLVELWGTGGRRLGERVGSAAGPAARVAVLEAAVRLRLADAAPVDPVSRAVLAALSARAPLATAGGAPHLPGGPATTARPARLAGPAAIGLVASLAAGVGLSERQVHRRCLAAFGYGAKTLDRVLRLQRVLALSRRGPATGLAGLAAAAGYADQAHLAHECRALAGATPTALLLDRAVSDPDKTGAAAAA